MEEEHGLEARREAFKAELQGSSLSEVDWRRAELLERVFELRRLVSSMKELPRRVTRPGILPVSEVGYIRGTLYPTNEVFCQIGRNDGECFLLRKSSFEVSKDLLRKLDIVLVEYGAATELENEMRKNLEMYTGGISMAKGAIWEGGDQLAPEFADLVRQHKEDGIKEIREDLEESDKFLRENPRKEEESPFLVSHRDGAPLDFSKWGKLEEQVQSYEQQEMVLKSMEGDLEASSKDTKKNTVKLDISSEKDKEKQTEQSKKVSLFKKQMMAARGEI